jgi:vitamin B12 transporter
MKGYMRFNFFNIFAFIFCFMQFGIAFSQSSNFTNLDPITVSGSRIEQKLSNTITSTSVFLKDEIRKSGSKTIADFLQGEIATEVGRSGGLGTQTSFFLRGAESRNVLILLDGVRVRDGITQSALAEHIPIAIIDRIEVVRGNVSALYGDGAIGGAIIITTNSNSKNNASSSNKNISFEIGEFNTKDLSFNYNFKSDDGLNLNLGTQHLKSDGFSASNPSKTFSSDPTDQDDDSYENNSLRLGVNKIIGDATFGVQFYGTRSKTMFDNSFMGNDPRQNTDHNLTSLFFQKQSNDYLTTRFDYSISEIELSYNYGDLFKTEQNQLSILNTFNFSDKGKIIFGYENRDQVRSPASSGLSKREVNSVFFGYIADFNPFSLQLNLRNDDAQDIGSELTHFLGASIKIDEKKSAFFSISSAFGIPTAYALSTNPILKPENHDSYELGLKYLDNNLSFKLVYFDTDTTNPITYDPADNYIAKNFKSFKNNGIEISAKTNYSNHNLNFSWTLQDPISPNGLNPNNSVQSARRARSFGSLNYIYSKGNLSLNLKGISSSSRKDTDYSSTRLGKYFVINAGLEYELKNDFKIHVRALNLTDSNYELAYGYNTIPRFISIGFSLNNF